MPRIGFMDGYRAGRDDILLMDRTRKMGIDYRAIDAETIPAIEDEKRRLGEKTHLLWNYLIDGHEPRTTEDNVRMVLRHPVIYAGLMVGLFRHPIKHFMTFSYPVIDPRYDD